VLASKVFDYLLGRKKNSGSIRDTDSEVVWKAEVELRHDITAAYKETLIENEQLREQIEKWKKRVETLEDENWDLQHGSR